MNDFMKIRDLADLLIENADVKSVPNLITVRELADIGLNRAKFFD